MYGMDTAGPGTAEPLIGVEDVETPYWARSQLEAARSGIGTVARGAPRTAALLIAWSWRAAPRWTLLALAVQVATAVVTGFGLFATVDVFANLLAAGPTPQRVVAALPALAVVVAALAAKGALQAAAGAVQAQLVPRIEERAQDQLYGALVDVELVAFDDGDFVDLVERAEFALLEIRFGARMVGDLAAAAVAMAAAVVTAGVLHPALGPLVFLTAVPQAWAGMRGAQLHIEAMVRMNASMRRRSVTGELLTQRENAAELRAFTARQLVLREHRRIAAALADDAVRVGQRANLLTTFGRGLSGLSAGLGYVVLGLLLHAGELPLALAGTAVLAMRTAAQAITSSIYSVNQLFEVGMHVDLYRTCLDDLAVRRRPPAVHALDRGPEVIALDGVSFRYPAQDHDAVHGVSLTLRRGEVIALVGENGSGKTTLAKLVTGLYLPRTGTVRWDGRPTGEIDADDLWARVAVVMQEPLRWPVTAENNIRVGRPDRPDPDGAVLADAAARSGADAVLADLPDGPRTILSRRFRGGRDLSGGQWQRISVARGLYRDAPVVVADEPTAAMDARAEHAAFAALRSMSRAGGDGQGRITVLVTHRLANVRHADRIVVLDHGRVADLGTHDELMARGGLYPELFDLQARAYADDRGRA
jgi:ATP-binding cassette subfamily B protein